MSLARSISYLLLLPVLCLIDARPAAAIDHPSQDDTKLLDAFRKGSFSGRFRYYFMSTFNKDSLSDYYANAAGGFLHFQTAGFHGFRIAAGSSFTYNIGSSDLSASDPATGARSRYEPALFDVTDPGNRFNMARLDELNLSYETGGSDSGSGKCRIAVGKQLLNTDFINEQDGRMRPTAADGLMITYARKKFSISGGWLWGISPRGTPHGYSVQRSIGIYGQGTNPDGRPGNYRNNLATNGIGLLDIRYTGKIMSLKLSELLAENIFNTARAEGHLILLNKQGTILSAGGQVIRQDAVKDGGNRDPAKAYMQPGASCMVFSGRLRFEKEGRQSSRFSADASFTSIEGNSRFLSPREWGREPFFTFIPRERIEGTGNTRAVTLHARKEFAKCRFVAEVWAGYVQLADVRDHRFNKYGLPSYAHFLVRPRYHFSGAFTGLNAEMLCVYKKNLGNIYNNQRYLINKTDMALLNVILNYEF